MAEDRIARLTAMAQKIMSNPDMLSQFQAKMSSPEQIGTTGASDYRKPFSPRPVTQQQMLQGVQYPTKSVLDAAGKAVVDEQSQEGQRKAEQFRQTQTARVESIGQFNKLTPAEQEKYEIVPVGFKDDGSIERKVQLKQEYKPTQAREKREVEKKQLSNEIEGLFQSFASARKEAETNPLVGEYVGQTGPAGRIAGKVVSAAGKMGLSPAVNVYNKKRKAFATVVAKAAGEVRPTDVDIERFLGTLMNPDMSDAENELIMQDLMTKVDSGGINALTDIWKQATGKEVGGSIPASAKLIEPTIENISKMSDEELLKLAGGK